MPVISPIKVAPLWTVSEEQFITFRQDGRTYPHRLQGAVMGRWQYCEDHFTTSRSHSGTPQSVGLGYRVLLWVDGSIVKITSRLHDHTQAHHSR